MILKGRSQESELNRRLERIEEQLHRLTNIVLNSASEVAFLETKEDLERRIENLEIKMGGRHAA